MSPREVVTSHFKNRLCSAQMITVLASFFLPKRGTSETSSQNQVPTSTKHRNVVHVVVVPVNTRQDKVNLECKTCSRLGQVVTVKIH